MFDTVVDIPGAYAVRSPRVPGERAIGHCFETVHVASACNECFHSAGRSLSVIWAVSGRGARQAVANSNFNFCMFICFCIYDNLPSNDCYKANIAVFLHIVS